MRSRTLLSFGLLFAASTLSFAASKAPVVISGQIMVKVKPGQDLAANFAIKAAGVTVGRSIPQIGWLRLNLPKNLTVAAAKTKLARISAFSKVEPVYLRKADDLPNDPRVSEQYSITKMHVDEAWNLTHGDSSVLVADIDTGVDYTHPDLSGHVILGKDFIGGDDDPMDVHGHGTHVAGILGATTNNGVGVAGIGYNVTILAVRVLGDDGGGTSETVANGMIYAADQGAKIGNMSLGGAGYTDLELDAANYANAHGTLLIAAAGNDGSPAEHYPGAFPVCLCVGASDQNDSMASFSNHGNSWVDVAAPGVGILSTVMGAGYEAWDGTSMATPNVSGVASLIAARSGNALSNDDIRLILENTSDYIGDWISHGRINAYEAVSHVGTPIEDAAVGSDPVGQEGEIVSGGTSSALSSADSFSVTVRGAKVPALGLAGSFSTEFQLTQFPIDKLVSGTLDLTASGDKNVTLQIYIQNAAGNWEVFKSLQVNPTAKAFQIKFNLSQLTKYMNGTSSLKMLFRGVLPNRLKGSNNNGYVKIDQGMMTFKGFILPTL